MEKKKTKKVSTSKKSSTPKNNTKTKKDLSSAMFMFRCAAVVTVALVFTAGQRIGELVYYLFS